LKQVPLQGTGWVALTLWWCHIYNSLMIHSIGNKSWANVRAMRADLVLFEDMSGLKVNFHKSSLVGVNINTSWLSEEATVLGFKVGKVSFLYLGLPVGGDPRWLLF